MIKSSLIFMQALLVLVCGCFREAVERLKGEQVSYFLGRY